MVLIFIMLKVIHNIIACSFLQWKLVEYSRRSEIYSGMLKYLATDVMVTKQWIIMIEQHLRLEIMPVKPMSNEDHGKN